MRVFGRDCVASGNWGAGLPWLLSEMHHQFALERLDSSEQECNDYWKRPDVFDDLQQLFEAALAAQPASVKFRSAYASVAFRAGRWKLADELFTALGDEVDLHALEAPRSRYESMRKDAAQRARQE